MEANGPLLIAQIKVTGTLMMEAVIQAHGGMKTESQVELGQQIPPTQPSSIFCTPQKVMMASITTKMENKRPTGSIMTNRMEVLGSRKMD
jgi:hypothetical protein